MIVAHLSPESTKSTASSALSNGKEQSALRNADHALNSHLSLVPPFDADRRRAAMAHLKHLGWPKVSQEAWKYVSLGKLTPLEEPQAFAEASALLSSPILTNPEVLEAFYVHAEAYRLVLINGRIASQYCVLPVHGPQVASLKWLLNTPDATEVLGARWSSQAPSPDALNLLNTALWSDGAAIIARAGDVPELPLEILLIHDPATAETPVSMPRVLLWAKPGTRLNVLVQSVVLAPSGTSEQAAPTLGNSVLVNSVVETWVDDAARLDLVLAQSGESPQSSQFLSHVATQGKDSVLNVTNLMSTSGVARNRLTLTQTASGAESSLSAMALPTGQAEHHLALDVTHAQPHGRSNQNVRMIVRDKARAEFDGHITILQGAQQIDARQLCKSLLLSPEAKAYARPWLNIAADDVKCAHGATVGQLSEQELFYLTSRGISPESARRVLMEALVLDLLSHIQDDITRAYFTRMLTV